MIDFVKHDKNQAKDLIRNIKSDYGRVIKYA